MEKEDLVQKCKKLVKNYKDLKEQTDQRVLKNKKGDGYIIKIASKPLLPNHIVVRAFHTKGKEEGNPIKVEGGLKDMVENEEKKEELENAFKGVIEGIRLLKEKIDPDRIYLCCFADSGELHFHLYPVNSTQKPFRGRALDWLSWYERTVDSIPKPKILEKLISENNLNNLEQIINNFEILIDHLDQTIKKLCRGKKR